MPQNSAPDNFTEPKMEIENSHVGSNNSRVCTINFNEKKLLTPFYFPSITSAETRSDITQTIDFIIKRNYPGILVSCYDLFQLEQDGIMVDKQINKYHLDGGIVLLDSGEFENFHFKGNWKFESYEKILNQTKADFFTSFDKTTVFEDTQKEIDEFSDKYIPKSEKCSKEKKFIAICHGIDEASMCNSIQKMLNDNNQIQIIAIPERECGRTIIDQCKTISKIRQTINGCNKNTIIHILGCGNPISIAAFVYAGADTFDAVDWCKWAIDPTTFEYGNLAHLRLFDCKCDACDTIIRDERDKVWLHNLTFYHYFLIRLRKAIKKKKSLIEFLKSENIDQKVISSLSILF